VTVLGEIGIGSGYQEADLSEHPKGKGVHRNRSMRIRIPTMGTTLPVKPTAVSTYEHHMEIPVEFTYVNQ
jgi:hypothetical protein